MTTQLIRPDNKQPGEFVGMARGYICLRTTCITSAVRWYSETDMDADNPVATCAEPPPMHIYPMPAMYPRDVFLGITNAHLEMVRRAVASGQIPEAA